MIGQWSLLMATGTVPEIKTEPIRLAFHLVAELFTAICLLLSGIAMLRQVSWSKVFGYFAGGLLAYTVIASPRYFAQQGQWPIVAMFAILLGLDIVSVRYLMLYRGST
jgi:hypothetical protein